MGRSKLEASRSHWNRRCSSACFSRGRGNHKASTQWWWERSWEMMRGLSTVRCGWLSWGSRGGLISPSPCSSCPDPASVPAASLRVWLCSSLSSNLGKYFQSQVSLLYLSNKLNLIYLYLEEFGGVVGDFFPPRCFSHRVSLYDCSHSSVVVIVQIPSSDPL